jgi:phosphatidylserine decarboxylase
LTLPEITIQKLILEFCFHFQNLKLKIEAFNDNDDEEATNKDKKFYQTIFVQEFDFHFGAAMNT